MHIHEYQGKALLKEFGVPVLKGCVAFSKDEVYQHLSHFNFEQDGIAIKAQIHAGGRWKAGGVQVVNDQASLDAMIDRILGKPLVTAQTKPGGQIVRTLYLEQTCTIQHEYYLSMALDRKNKGFTVIASAEGGVNIEDVAEKTPEKVLFMNMNPIVGYQAFHGRRLASFLKVPTDAQKSLMAILKSLYDAFTTLDAELIEINPLVLTDENTWIALDAKMTFDDNAMPRQKRVACLFDEYEVDASELRAQKFDLNYIKLDGTIGCMVNGAGLAMATMDIIQGCGASPANFLDVGGGATAERVTEAFKIITEDPDVRAIFVNIFGGIMRCDIIAEGIITAAHDLNLNVPVVVRLQGTNVERGRERLTKSGLNLYAEDDFARAARRVVELSRGV